MSRQMEFIHMNAKIRLNLPTYFYNMILQILRVSYSYYTVLSRRD